jgi:plasmid stability protein
MSMKKFELEKMRGLKVTGQMKAAGIPSRFAEGAGEVLDKRERRQRDAALGLVPFACKLPSELTRRLNERAALHEGGMNGLLAELLVQALDAGEPAKPKAAAKKAAVKDSPKEAPKEAPVAAKEVAAPAAKKKAVSRKP